MSRMTNLPFIKSIQRNVTTAGTPVQANAGFALADGLTVVIKAKQSNTGLIRVAGNSTDAASSSTAFTLRPGDAVALQVSNLNGIWLDSTVNAEGVEIIFETAVAQ